MYHHQKNSAVGLHGKMICAVYLLGFLAHEGCVFSVALVGLGVKGEPSAPKRILLCRHTMNIGSRGVRRGLVSTRLGGKPSVLWDPS